MASVRTPRKWRAKNRLVKRQLNIMAKGLMRQADFNHEAGRSCHIFAASTHRDRDIHAP